MALSALADALTDFGSARRQFPPAPAAMPVVARQVPTAAAPSVAEDITARIAIEVARAQAELSERLTSDHAEALARERASHAQAIADLTHRQGEELGRLVSEGMETIVTRLVDTTAETVARILALTLSEEMQKRALDALADTLRATLDREAPLRIRISGPRTLYEPLAGAMGDLAVRLDYRETDAFDLTVEFDERVLETRLAEWRETLAQVMT